MDAFERELSDRLPLAAAVLETFRFAFDERQIQQLYDQHRGRSYTAVLRFPCFLAMVRDALLQHGGSGHRLCTEQQRAGTLPVDESSFYRKLANMPVAVSRALLRQCTGQLTQLLPTPAANLLPACFESFEVVVIDGKKVKNAAKRLKPTRGYKGALLGAKTLVAMPLRSGLAIAMSDSLDGEANDLPLLPDLLPQVHQVIPRPVLWMADRQFGDLHTPRRLSERAGDAYVLRYRKGIAFQADPDVPRLLSHDEQGREVIDEIGVLGSGKNALRVRRVTLRRRNAAGEEDDVVLITDLLDRQCYGALELLKLYRRRWGIENMFQQVTETFSLQHLIGSSPKAVLFQMALCLLMYNLVQIVKAYVAQNGKVPREAVSTANLFYDIRRELSTWSYFELLMPRRSSGGLMQMQQRLRELLAGSWDPLAYLKAVDKRPRTYRKKKSLHGGHSSVQRLLEGKVKVRVTKG
jgi:hypothetical protein